MAWKKPSKSQSALHLKTRHVIRGRRKATTEFFKNCPWDKWWHEFITARDKTGRMKYVSAYGFAKSKAKTDTELDLIYRAIGPVISIKDVQQIQRVPGHAVPYLGDWQQIRAKAYFYDNESVNELRKATKEKLNGLEAGRGSARVIIELIQKWMSYDTKIDEMFEGSPFKLEKPAPGQDRYAAMFFKYKNITRRAISELTEMLLACHGITHNGMNDLGQLVMAVTQAGAKAALTGAVSGALDPSSNAALMLSTAILDKARTFNMPLPAAVMNGREEEGEQEGGEEK